VRELADNAVSEVIEDERLPRFLGFRLSSRLSAQLGNAVQTSGPAVFQQSIEDKPDQTKSLEALSSLPKG